MSQVALQKGQLSKEELSILRAKLNSSEKLPIKGSDELRRLAAGFSLKLDVMTVRGNYLCFDVKRQRETEKLRKMEMLEKQRLEQKRIREKKRLEQIRIQEKERYEQFKRKQKKQRQIIEERDIYLTNKSTL